MSPSRAFGEGPPALVTSGAQARPQNKRTFILCRCGARLDATSVKALHEAGWRMDATMTTWKCSQCVAAEERETGKERWDPAVVRATLGLPPNEDAS